MNVLRFAILAALFSGVFGLCGAKSFALEPLRISVSVSVEIPQQWKDMLKQIKLEDRLQLLKFIREYKKDFKQKDIKERLDRESKKVGHYMGLNKKSKTLFNFFCDNLLPTQHNIIQTVRYCGSNKVMHQFLKSLESCLEEIIE